MKVEFLKDTPNGDHKKGDVKNINDWRANYWNRTGVTREYKEKKQKKATPKKENKNAAPKDSETK